MEELLEKIDNLKISLDNQEEVKKIKELNKQTTEDRNLLELISKYKEKPSEELKKEIYKNELYKKYKESETDINLLIMSINNKLKEINNRGNCR
ncbi:MAG: hypothetical protein E7160_00200 [Firmicutes bacterium]|nr:hypothetical protein [Bacillota bacterium]